MKEIRIHGRGGQGSVTMAQMLAQAAFADGKWSQGFPSFGVERLGAPVQAFTRIDDTKITDRSQVDTPDYVIVQDPSLIGLVDVLKGLHEEGRILMNSTASPEDVDLETDNEIITVDATNIALEHLGRPIMNTALMGAFSGATGLIKKESIIKVVKRKFPGEIGDKNVGAINDAFERVE
ncbi:pyruvate ferredoxin oxidoreductase [candidate division MSBL1 archaeon SCGC-AAA259E19]|uniref:pyruvate synthase n=1 Tax=candidate division MSBL1 archaeon SCGC-AAA259E19 TaxID=1698264 RepID=A0A133ULM8_9EURY|nr:pyruvate ferredoxin oxidoreductase [candidate division MSBL1 archaeon SCGC-AAA259E19]